MLGPLWVGVSGHTLTQDEKIYLQNPAIGGVVLFSRNVDTPEQVIELTKAIKALRNPSLLIAVDQEGGRVARLRSGFSTLPSLGQIGLCFQKDFSQGLALARQCGWLMATEVLSVGIDLSFAPVIDVECGVSKVIGDRSFATDPIDIAVLARAYCHGMQEAGMQSTAKHYPGHGAVVADSHCELPVDTRSYNEILERDLLPFTYLIRHQIAAIMVAHVQYPQIDNALAGYSAIWIQEILRSTLGFSGVIISDDLGMQAAHVVGEMPSRLQHALQAGCNIVLVCNELNEIPALCKIVNEQQLTDRTELLLTLRGYPTLNYAALKNSPRWQAATTALNDLN